MSDAVIEVDRLSRRFGELTAVRDVSFRVERGAIFGLLGPNGSGKSTILRMLLGILPPSGGAARVLGEDAWFASETIKPRVGYMSQRFTLYADLTVRENLEFYGRIYGLAGARLAERVGAVLELTALEANLGQLAGTLSGGWQRRLGLACALIHEPELLFLDEPTAGIDPVARRQLWDLLFALSGRGVTLLVTTHYMDEAERCTEVGYIYLADLLVHGKPDALKALPVVHPAGTRRYEVRVPAAAERLAGLRDQPEVRDATLFGETVHTLVEESLTPPRLLERLGLPPSGAEVREIPPSLEDVFVTLTKHAESRRGGPADTGSAGTAEVDASSAKGPPSGSERPSSGAERRPDAPHPRETAGFAAILTKEFAHIRRQPTTLFFMLVVPVMQTIIFGYAIDTQIENIPTVVWDMDGRQAARDLVAAFVNTRRFAIVAETYDEDAFFRHLTAGRAKAGVRIPPDYSERLLRGEQAPVQVLIDGSDSQTATAALSASQQLGFHLSIQLARAKGEALQTAPARDPTGRGALPIDMRPRLLYNPDLESARFFVPGLVGIILQLVTLFLTSFAVVRERELGTLEQLFVTPVGRLGLLLGKLVPYAAIGFVELLIVLTVMIYVFDVPIHGSATLLLALAMLFMVCSLGLGLLVSTAAQTQLEAVQIAFVIMLPSVLLSGFVFPRSEMPLPIYLLTFGIPATYFIEILRGIVLRAAGAADLVGPIAGIALCGWIVMTLSVMRFRKRLA
jgi:ABC transporter DrrB family efflux protein